jgi:hypothetical protein
MKQVGTDYADAKEVEAYDARMRTFRDIRSETEKILESLHITQDQTLLERAGFHIDKKEYSEGFMAVYECTKC